MPCGSPPGTGQELGQSRIAESLHKKFSSWPGRVFPDALPVCTNKGHRAAGTSRVSINLLKIKRFLV
jgi:hypothetical protein